MIRKENEYKIWREVVEVLERKEEDENQKEKVICNTCGNDTFHIYITTVIDDARLYCTKCGKEPDSLPEPNSKIKE